LNKKHGTSTEDTILIKTLRQKKGYWARKLTAKFPKKTCIALSGLSYTYEKSRSQWSGGKAAGQSVR